MFLTTVYSLCLACLLGIFSAHVSGCLIKRSPSTYVGFPTTNGAAQTLYGCVSSTVNCEYEVHVIANYESSNGRHGIGIPRLAGDTHVQFNINGQSSKPLVLVFISYEPVNWRLYLPSGVVVNRILLGGYYTSNVAVVWGTPATNVEVVPRSTLSSGYGSDSGGGRTAKNVIYLTKRFGPISSFSGSYRADRWTVNIERSAACNSSTSTEAPPPQLVRFKKESYIVNEGAGSVTLVLLTSHPNASNITVLYSTTDGTARAPMDYTAANQILSNIPAGNSRLNLTIPIQDDDLHELSETFQVQVLLPNSQISAIVVIIDNDPIVARLDRPSYIFSNNVTQGTVTVELTSRSEVDIILQYSITATCSRASVTNHRITIPAGSNKFEFNISITYIQIHEALLVKLSLASETTHGVTVGFPSQATIEINNVSCATCPTNSGTRCSFGDYCPGSHYTGASCVGEYCRCHGSSKYDNCTCLPHVSGCLIKRSPSTYVGFPTTNGGPQTLYGCVSSTVNCEYEVHVIANYESSNGRHGFGTPRVAGDTHVQFNINGQSSKPLIVVFTSYEPVNWRLSLPSGVVVNRILVSGYYASTVAVVSGTPATSVEVVPRSTLSFGYGSDNGGGRTADALGYLTNRFGPISSFSGSYRADRWTVNIMRSSVCNPSTSTESTTTTNPSTSTESITTTNPSTSTESITTTNPSTSTEPPQSVMIRFEKERYTVNEGARSVTLVLLINLPKAINVGVVYSTTDETARAPMDYTAVHETIIYFPAGNSRFNLTIPIRDDDLHELPETFQVQVSRPNEPVPAVVEIIDNDPVVVRFDESSYIFSNNATQGTVTVELIGRSEVDIILVYSITTDTIEGVNTHHRIIIPAGSNRIAFNISITNIVSDQGVLSLVGGTTRGVTVGAPSQAIIEINNGQSSLPPTTDVPSDAQSVRGYVGTIGGAIGGILVLTFMTVAVVYIAVKICHGRSRSTTRVSAHTSGNTAPTVSSGTQPHSPPAATFNLPQSQSPAPPLQSSTSSIIEAPPPAYTFYKMYTTYVGKEPSDAPPPYQPPSYDIAMGEATTA